jgi:hypothetical protein
VNIDEMQAGREMDYLIGRDVMGLDFSQIPSRRDYYWDGVMLEVPHFSTDISAAWEVVEKIKLTFFMRRLPSGKYVFGFMLKTDDSICTSNNAPEAICRAALKAVMGK